MSHYVRVLGKCQIRKHRSSAFYHIANEPCGILRVSVAPHELYNKYAGSYSLTDSLHRPTQITTMGNAGSIAGNLGGQAHSPRVTLMHGC